MYIHKYIDIQYTLFVFFIVLSRYMYSMQLGALKPSSWATGNPCVGCSCCRKQSMCLTGRGRCGVSRFSDLGVALDLPSFASLFGVVFVLFQTQPHTVPPLYATKCTLFGVVASFGWNSFYSRCQNIVRLLNPLSPHSKDHPSSHELEINRKNKKERHRRGRFKPRSLDFMEAPYRVQNRGSGDDGVTTTIFRRAGNIQEINDC